jgi:hypothetical protein
LHKAALRCCCRSPLAAAAAWSSPLLLAAADSSPSHASADNPPLATVSQRPLSVQALDRSAAVAARRSAAVAARRSAAAAARRSAAPLPRRCSTAAPCEAAAAFVFGSLPVLLATWISAPPQAGEKDERRFEKRNLCSRVPRLCFHVQAVLVSCQEPRSAWRDAGPAAGDSPQPPTRADEPRPLHQAAFHPVKAKMRPGAAATAHPRRRTAAGRHRPRTQRGTSCCAVTGASSAALRGRRMFRLLTFFHEPLSPTLSLPVTCP